MTADFETFLEALVAIARRSPGVVGLVGFGSTADLGRADEWSDHDFAWLTEPEWADRYRYDLSWLPDSDRIALSVVEHHGGVKVIYESGHRLEFGIADVSSFASWAGAPAHVLVGDESVRHAVERVVARRPEGETDAAREIRLMLTQLHSGVGRARRGETLSGSGLVRFEAINHLARAVASRLGDPSGRLDPLDPRRRFDAAHPEIAVELERAARLPIEECARAVLDLAESSLERGWEEFPHAGVAALRSRYEWSEAAPRVRPNGETPRRLGSTYDRIDRP